MSPMFRLTGVKGFRMLTLQQLLAKARENADACERIMKRKLTDSEYVWICQMVGSIERAKEEMTCEK